MCLVTVLFVVAFADKFDMSETVPEFVEKTADLLHVRLAGSRGSVMHTAWSPFSSYLTFVGLFFVWPWGLTRTMTLNLPVQLGSCVLSVLRGKVPHAALEIPSWECIVLIHTACPELYDDS